LHCPRRPSRAGAFFQVDETMSRIAGRFAQLKSEGRQALIPYVTAGDPVRAVTVPLMHAMVAAGADVIELGVPFPIPWLTAR